MWFITQNIQHFTTIFLILAISIIISSSVTENSLQKHTLKRATTCCLFSAKLWVKVELKPKLKTYSKSVCISLSLGFGPDSVIKVDVGGGLTTSTPLAQTHLFNFTLPACLHSCLTLDPKLAAAASSFDYRAKICDLSINSTCQYPGIFHLGGEEQGK